MPDNIKNEAEDFEVYPSKENSTSDFIDTLAKLRVSLTTAETRLRSRDNESHDEVLIRLALNATNNTNILFRKNATAEEAKIQAWLSIVTERSKSCLLRKSPAQFKGLTLKNLREIAKLSLQLDKTQDLISWLAQSYGIILIVEQGFTAMKMDGCVFKLSQGTPVVGISLRFNRYDNFWFTLMHELAHICLHYDQLDQPILDDLDGEQESDIEIEANIVARDSLVSRQLFRLIWNVRQDKEQFLDMCSKWEVHPAIASGLLRHQANNYALFPEYQNVMDMRQTFGFAND